MYTIGKVIMQSFLCSNNLIFLIQNYTFLKLISKYVTFSQDLLNNSKAGDSGMKLEVNSKILDSCTSLMQVIKNCLLSA